MYDEWDCVVGSRMTLYLRPSTIPGTTVDALSEANLPSDTKENVAGYIFMCHCSRIGLKL